MKAKQIFHGLTFVAFIAMFAIAGCDSSQSVSHLNQRGGSMTRGNRSNTENAATTSNEKESTAKKAAQKERDEAAAKAKAESDAAARAMMAEEGGEKAVEKFDKKHGNNRSNLSRKNKSSKEEPTNKTKEKKNTDSGKDAAAQKDKSEEQQIASNTKRESTDDGKKRKGNQRASLTRRSAKEMRTGVPASKKEERQDTPNTDNSNSDRVVASLNETKNVKSDEEAMAEKRQASKDRQKQNQRGALVREKRDSKTERDAETTDQVAEEENNELKAMQSTINYVVRGRVVAPNGKPIKGMQVTLLENTIDATPQNLNLANADVRAIIESSSDTTRSDGSFVVRTSAPRSYYLRVFVRDIDGPSQGNYANDIINVYFDDNNITDTGHGWRNGTSEREMTIRPKLKR